MEFVPVKDVLKDLLPILEQRLPDSAFLYNTAKLNPKWKDAQRWYTLGELSPTSLILVSTDRSDFNVEILISTDKNMKLTHEVKEALIKTKAIDWNDTHVFICLDVKMSSLIAEISTRVYGNDIGFHPSTIFTFPVEEAKNLEVNSDLGNHVTLGSISGPHGLEFFLNTWKYASKEGRDLMEKIVLRNPTAGVLVNDEVVCGVALHAHGAIGLLYTLKEHRGNKYAQSAMKLLIKQCAEAGLVPSCCVETRNQVSMAFQKKLGFVDRGIVGDSILYQKTTW